MLFCASRSMGAFHCLCDFQTMPGSVPDCVNIFFDGLLQQFFAVHQQRDAEAAPQCFRHHLCDDHGLAASGWRGTRSDLRVLSLSLAWS